MCPSACPPSPPRPTWHRHTHRASCRFNSAHLARHALAAPRCLTRLASRQQQRQQAALGSPAQRPTWPCSALRCHRSSRGRDASKAAFPAAAAAVPQRSRTSCVLAFRSSSGRSALFRFGGSGGMGASHSTHAAPFASQGSGSSLRRSRRMVALSAAAPAAPEAPTEEELGITVEFDNDSGEHRQQPTVCCPCTLACVTLSGGTAMPAPCQVSRAVASC